MNSNKSKQINLIRNGNFDEGSKYWSTTNGIPPYLGNGYLMGNHNLVVISDSFEVKPNTKYKLEFDLRSSGTITSQPVIRLTSYMNTLFESGITKNTQDWVTFSYDYTSDSRLTTLNFQIWERVTGGWYNLTNVKFFEVTE